MCHRIRFLLVFTAVIFLFTNCKLEVRESSEFLYSEPCTDKFQAIVNLKMENAKLYTQTDNKCELVVDPDNPVATKFFKDSDCKEKANFSPRNFESVCFPLVLNSESEVGGTNNWGSLALSSTETNWFYSQWARLRVFAYQPDQTPDNLIRPLVKEIVYHNPTNSAGNECKLTVRIYKNDLTTTTKTAIVLHGGGWEKRGLFAEISNDIIASVYTKAGYTVFAPYYRITQKTNNTGGVYNCYNATGTKILEDMDNFFIWLESNLQKYKTNANDILVQGNSAGAHLAAYLNSTHSDKIKDTVLFYGPMDMKFVLEQYRDANGIYKDIAGAGVEFIKLFMGVADLKTEPDITSDLVTKSTFTDPVLKNNVYIIHGSLDTLVAPETSVRLCEKLSGVPMSDGKYVYNETDYDRACGASKSKLFIIKDAGHVMDFNIPCTEKKATEELANILLGGSCSSNKFKVELIYAYDYILKSI